MPAPEYLLSVSDSPRYIIHLPSRSVAIPYSGPEGKPFLGGEISGCSTLVLHFLTGVRPADHAQGMAVYWSIEVEKVLGPGASGYGDNMPRIFQREGDPIPEVIPAIDELGAHIDYYPATGRWVRVEAEGSDDQQADK
ncbi:MAG: hypothetical protein ACYDC1_21935 [Limisphaerales bacterium]